MPSLHRFILHPEYGEPAHTKEIRLCTCSVWYVQGRLINCTRTDRQPVCSSFSGLLPLSFPLEMLAGMDPAVYGTYCHFGYEELTSRSPRICCWYIYSTNPFCCQSSRDLWKAELPGTERGTDPRARLLRGVAVVICTGSPSPVLNWDQCIWPLYSELSVPYQSNHADWQTVLEELVDFCIDCTASKRKSV